MSLVQRLNKGLLAIIIGERSDAAPNLRTNVAASRPALPRQVDEHSSQPRIAAAVEPLDRPETRSNEHRLHDHLIPSIFIKIFNRIGISMGDRFENRPHARTHALASARFEKGRSRIDRQPAAKRDQFVDFRGAAERVEKSGEFRVVARIGGGHERNARNLIDAPVARVKVLAEGHGPGKLLG